jgi:hypothetical protein
MSIESETYAILEISPNYQPFLRFNVIPMRYQVLLGRGWLKDTYELLSINWKTNLIMIGNNDFVQGYEVPRHHFLLTAKQFKRSIKGHDACLCLIGPLEVDTLSAQWTIGLS